MTKFYCRDCGRYFETENINQQVCTLCNRDWIEKLAKCENCKKEILAENLVDGLCGECRNLVKAKFLETFTPIEIKIISKYLENNDRLRS